MLEALERGVKGGRWHSLIDKVYSEANLRAAFGRVKRNRGSAGVDHVSVEAFEERLETNLKGLRESLRTGTYRPQAVKRRWIPKPGKREKRPLGIPTVRDRVVQTALRNVLEPIFEREFAEHSYGFRPERSCKDALRRANRLLEQGYTSIIDADIKGYFDSIPHDRLMERIRAKIADGRVRALVQAYLDQEVLDGLEAWTPETGTPQGAVISPLLANVYLDPLDHHLAAHGYQLVRYADDLVVVCRDQVEAERAMEVLRDWMNQAGLQLHPDKTRIVDYGAGEGFDFLGYEFKRGRRWPSRRSKKAIRGRMRSQTPRKSGHSLERTIETLNPILRGWFEYYKHSGKRALRDLDGYVRMRLRSMLRRRTRRKGRAKGIDHQRWPNAYFTTRGLYTLEHAHAQALQSSRR
jgi:RNA-directed DNA polymerase